MAMRESCMYQWKTAACLDTVMAMRESCMYQWKTAACHDCVKAMRESCMYQWTTAACLAPGLFRIRKAKPVPGEGSCMLCLYQGRVLHAKPQACIRRGRLYAQPVSGRILFSLHCCGERFHRLRSFSFVFWGGVLHAK
eukprot:1160466-Pelagomonas_calceolata.AAC.1